MGFRKFDLVEFVNVKTVPLEAWPIELQPLIEKNTTFEQAVDILWGLLKPIQPADINCESSYYKVILSDEIPVLEKNADQVSNWASGGGLARFREPPLLYRFKNDRLTTFFENVFQRAAVEIPAILCRNNLFHGHAVFDVDQDNKEVDFRIVFHAYEYPLRTQRTKSEQVSRLDSGITTCDIGPDYYKRNAIWSMSKNMLYIPDYVDYILEPDENPLSKFPYGRLLKKGEGVRLDDCVVDQAMVGDEIVAFNDFKQENVRLFLKS